jgi:hypothetical protein
VNRVTVSVEIPRVRVLTVVIVLVVVEMPESTIELVQSVQILTVSVLESSDDTHEVSKQT